MPDRYWRTPRGEFALVIDDQCWRSIEKECSRWDGMETGGILIGYYTSDKSTAIVTEASGPPRDSRRGPTWFQRGVAGLTSLLGELWRQSQRTHYLGEWHYHPSPSVEPSQEDIDQMVSISTSPNYRCQEPIMLVVGRTSSGRRPVRAFVFPNSRAHLEFQEEDGT